MSAEKNKRIKWQHVVGISLVCGLTIAGCDRSDKEDRTEDTAATAEQTKTQDNAATPAVNCDNPMVQDRLKAALKNTLDQQAQTSANNYANQAEISLNSESVLGKINTVAIDIQNPTAVQNANANGITTCQASVSMTLPSEDLYQANAVQAANNQPSLQTRLSQSNIKVNNNQLIDEAFTYIIGTQGGQVRARIAGQPTIIAAVADIMSESLLKTTVDEQRAQRQAAQAKPTAPRRRETPQNNNDSQPIRQPKAVAPAQPVRPSKPATPAKPAVDQRTAQSNQQSSKQNNTLDNTQSTSQTNAQTSQPASVKPSSGDKGTTATPSVPKIVPNDDSIHMDVIEDKNATY